MACAAAILAALIVMSPAQLSSVGRAQTAGNAKPDAPQTEIAKPETAKPETATPERTPAAQNPTAEKPTVENPWVTLAALPQPASDLSGVAVNGKLYLFGGLDGNRPTGLAFEYDTATDTWTKKKAMPVPAHRFAIATHGDQIYLFGGFKYPDNGAKAWQPVDNAWRYDPASDEWTALASLPGKRGAAGAAVVDGKIFVLGGATTQPDTKDTAIQPLRRHAIVGAVEEYDPKANTWRARTALPTPRSHAAVAVVGGKIYVIGGRIASAFGEDGSDIDVVEAYDPARDLWSRPLERMPSPRSAMGAANWRNRIVIAGGETSNATNITAAATVSSYEPGTNTWRTLGPWPDARRGIATGLIGDRFYVVGGAAVQQVAPAPENAAKKPAESKPAESPGSRITVQALQLDVLK